MDKEKRTKIEARLARIEEKHGGVLRPDDVIKDARNPKSPLHDQCEWDDTAAARKYRQDQARTLIRTVRVVVEVNRREISTPRYVRDPGVGEAQGYTDVMKLKGEDELARDALAAEVVRIRAFIERTRSIAIVLGLEERLEELLGMLDSYQQAA